MKWMWINALIGEPWTPQRNCWDLVQRVQREQFGREMPALDIGGQPTRAQWQVLRELLSPTTHWRPVPQPARAGDVLVVQGIAGAHVGVFVDPKRVLHKAGGLEKDGKASGATCLQDLRDLLATGYSRPEIWRHRDV